MPPKSINKATPKAFKGKVDSLKTKKAKTIIKKHPSKSKAPPKTPKSSLNPERTCHSRFRNAWNHLP
ncbi:hypothetical protein DSO57_1016163 [Entomophthora muscae]|uniref:Uncharacterized protein n=1 Tax=Entomophthora muscae TaxID=34485 RepID=A0ACC2U3B3_9FUNG|nr:hypothetical protein DSO57_1016163 [Entomophthora muscae]